MDAVYLKNVLPEIFLEKEPAGSEIWRQEVCFSKGETVLVKAASGAGKSSLCSYIYGYRRDFAGNIFFDGKDIRSLKRGDWECVRRTSLGIVFQDLRLFAELTAFENVEVKNSLTGFRTADWIRECFLKVGLGDKMEEKAGKLSFGQQQRVALIRALCQPLDFILLDEPVSHLDRENNRICGELLTEEARSQGAGVLVTSVGYEPEMIYDKVFRL